MPLRRAASAALFLASPGATGHAGTGILDGLVEFAQTLRDADANFVVDSGSQGVAESKHSGATKAIPCLIKTIKLAVKTLDALYQNVFDGDAEMLGAWNSASHVEKVAVRNPRQPKTDGEASTGGGAPAAGGATS